MDPLSMGIFYVVPGCVLWIFGREPKFAARVGYYRNTLDNYISVLQTLIGGIEGAIYELKKDYKL